MLINFIHHNACTSEHRVPSDFCHLIVRQKKTISMTTNSSFQMLLKKCYAQNALAITSRWLTSVIATSSNFPEYQAKSIDIGSLERLEMPTINGFVEHFGCHVSAGSNAVVWCNVDWASVYVMLHSKPCTPSIQFCLQTGLSESQYRIFGKQ